MRFKQLVDFVISDLHRHTGRVNVAIFLRNILFNPGFKYSFWMRVTRYLGRHSFLKYSLFYLSSFMLAHYRYKYGIDIPPDLEIGKGLYIGHFGGIVVGADSIGKNFSISQDVTLGQINRGKRKGRPTIGDNVYLAAGAKVIGKIRVGNNAAIGANAVVTKDVPDNAVVVGIPGKVISYDGSAEYVINSI